MSSLDDLESAADALIIQMTSLQMENEMLRQMLGIGKRSEIEPVVRLPEKWLFPAERVWYEQGYLVGWADLSALLLDNYDKGE